MRRIGIAALILLVSAATSWAGGPNDRYALLQPRTIFHSGLAGQHIIAMTFDDGPNADTPAVLDTLKRFHIKATFFIVGEMAHRYPAVLARIAAEGHLLANHSATHPVLDSRYDATPDLLLEQLRDVDDQIAPLMQPSDKFFFRAPYGYWKAAHAQILNVDPLLRKYIGPIFWDNGGEISMSRDGYVMSAADWECWKHGWTAKTCAKGYLREIRRSNGGVVLMHCVYSKSAALVEAVVPALIEEGYTFVRLDEVPGYERYETTPPAVASVTPPKQMIRISVVR